MARRGLPHRKGSYYGRNRESKCNANWLSNLANDTQLTSNDLNVLNTTEACNVSTGAAATGAVPKHSRKSQNNGTSEKSVTENLQVDEVEISNYIQRIVSATVGLGTAEDLKHMQKEMERNATAMRQDLTAIIRQELAASRTTPTNETPNEYELRKRSEAPPKPTSVPTTTTKTDFVFCFTGLYFTKRIFSTIRKSGTK